MVTRANIIKYKNLTKMNYDIEKISNDTTLKGLFAKEILERMNSGEYDKETLSENRR